MSVRLLTTAALLLHFSASARAREPAPQAGAPAEKLGAVHFATSCAPATAGGFDRAMALLHSFEFGPAITAFNGVLAQDPNCAMAYWGIALARWQNPFTLSLRPPQQLKTGQSAVDRARQVSAKATARERGYIDAAAELYKNSDHVPQRDRVVAYSRAMQALAESQPQDTEAKIFYALSLTASAPPTDKTYANQLKAAAILEPIFAKKPDHPGLAHYLIHTYDVPALAPKATGAARHYADIAPSAAHALHMPSHTFTRIGSWEESIATNQRAIEAAKREGSFGEALHATDYMTYAYLQLGRDSAAKALVDGLPALARRFDVKAIGAGGSGSAGTFALAAIPARYALERRDWKAAAALETRTTTDAWSDAMTHFARALGAANVGDFAKAQHSIDSLAAMQARLTKAGESYWAEQVAIQGLEAQAGVAMAHHRHDEAVALMRKAAEREDATEKSAVTPGPLAPARELLGDMLMDLDQPKGALPEYQATLTHEPNRFRALYGAMRAASEAGDRATATRYRSQLQALCKNADTPGRPELKEIRGKS